MEFYTKPGEYDPSTTCPILKVTEPKSYGKHFGFYWELPY